MAKEQKTNAMRILDRNKVDYTVNLYDCPEFIDAVTVADQLGQPYESSFKTLVAVGKSGGHFVFVSPIAAELDLKAAASLTGNKRIEMVHVKDLLGLTGYIRGGCSPVGMKKKFPTFVDESALQHPKITVSSGARGAQLLISTEALLQFIQAKTLPLTVK